MRDVGTATQPGPHNERQPSLCEDIGRRTWNDLSEDEQWRVKRMLTPHPDDNLDDLVARCERALQIIRGEA